ncbi:MAG: DUF4271 domain-containing protein [Candidatus Azobacteroides sp.]|nr:DUF4271 domain-containing protein [Candidatus Azobacteroides sp.]
MQNDSSSVSSSSLPPIFSFSNDEDINYLEKPENFFFSFTKPFNTEKRLEYEGILRPYSFKMSSGITFLMLICFFLFVIIYKKGGDYIVQMTQNLFGQTERDSIFVDSTTSSEYQIKFFLLLQSTICLAVFFFIFIKSSAGSNVFLPDKYIIINLLLGIGVILIFWCLKWLMNKFIGYIFFDNQLTENWQSNYFFAIGLLGTLFFPVLLFIINAQNEVLIHLSTNLFFLLFGLGFLIFAFKGIRVFLVKPYGFFYFMLYFCALEIIPYIGLYMGLIYITNFV